MDVVNYSAVLIASYHMMMRWSQGCLHLPNEVAFIIIIIYNIYIALCNALL